MPLKKPAEAPEQTGPVPSHPKEAHGTVYPNGATRLSLSGRGGPALNKSTAYRKWWDDWKVRKRRDFAHLDHFRNDVGLYSLAGGGRKKEGSFPLLFPLVWSCHRSGNLLFFPGFLLSQE